MIVAIAYILHSRPLIIRKKSFSIYPVKMPSGKLRTPPIGIGSFGARRHMAQLNPAG